MRPRTMSLRFGGVRGPKHGDAVRFEGGGGPLHAGLVRQRREPTADRLIEVGREFGDHGCASFRAARLLYLQLQVPYA